MWGEDEGGAGTKQRQRGSKGGEERRRKGGGKEEEEGGGRKMATGGAGGAGHGQRKTAAPAPMFSIWNIMRFAFFAYFMFGNNSGGANGRSKAIEMGGHVAVFLLARVGTSVAKYIADIIHLTRLARMGKVLLYTERERERERDFEEEILFRWNHKWIE